MYVTMYVWIEGCNISVITISFTFVFTAHQTRAVVMNFTNCIALGKTAQWESGIGCRSVAKDTP